MKQTKGERGKAKEENPKCYNCKYGGVQFKLGDVTHLHCTHPKYPEADFISGKLSAWDTLMKFSDTCMNHEFKLIE